MKCVPTWDAFCFTHFTSMLYWFAESAILHDFLAVLQGALKQKDRQYIIRLTNKQHKLGAGGDVCEKHCKNRVMEGHP